MTKSTKKKLLIAAGAVAAAVVVYKVVQARGAARSGVHAVLGHVNGPLTGIAAAQQVIPVASDDNFEVVDEWAYSEPPLMTGWGR